MKFLIFSNVAWLLNSTTISSRLTARRTKSLPEPQIYIYIYIQSTCGGGAAASIPAASQHRRNSKIEAEAYFGGFWMHAMPWLSPYTKVCTCV
jgi:hypothetical protein